MKIFIVLYFLNKNGLLIRSSYSWMCLYTYHLLGKQYLSGFWRLWTIPFNWKIQKRETLDMYVYVLKKKLKYLKI